jgi:hypothetical protein
MKGDKPITIKDTHLSQDIAQNASATSDPVDLELIAADGIFSLEVVIGASSTSTSVTITCEMSNNGTSFKVPEGDSDIATTVDVSSGIDKIYNFEPTLGRFMRIVVTENNTGTVVGLITKLAVQ